MRKKKQKVDLDNKYVKMLPSALREKLQNSDVFIRACEKRLIVCEEGQWVSNFENICVLSYFCGCCFCGDKAVGTKLFKGNHRMPTKKLEKLFGVDHLREGRKKYCDRKISESCKNIDFLFFMLE